LHKLVLFKVFGRNIGRAAPLRQPNPSHGLAKSGMGKLLPSFSGIDARRTSDKRKGPINGSLLQRYPRGSSIGGLGHYLAPRAAT